MDVIFYTYIYIYILNYTRFNYTGVLLYYNRVCFGDVSFQKRVCVRVLEGGLLEHYQCLSAGSSWRSSWPPGSVLAACASRRSGTWSRCFAWCGTSPTPWCRTCRTDGLVGHRMTRSHSQRSNQGARLRCCEVILAVPQWLCYWLVTRCIMGVMLMIQDLGSDPNALA